MAFVKNRGTNSNLLSRRDGMQVLKDAHSMDEFALDTITANSLIPKRYSKITWEFQTLGDGSEDVKYLFFWGFGEYESNQIEIYDSPLGLAEKTTINFVGKTPASLSNTYFIIYDDVGSVAVWFNLDGVGSQPVVVVNRFIEVSINTGDSVNDLALAAKTAIHADSEFTCANLTSYIMIASISYGNKPNSLDGDSGLSISTVDGHETLNSKYIYLYDGNGNKYYVWWNVNSTGIDPNPDPGNATPIEVLLDIAETPTTVATKTAAQINLNDVFRASNEDMYVVVINTHEGVSQGVIDGNTGLIIDSIKKGEDKPLIAQLEIKYDDEYLPISVEVIKQQDL
jgi:hypothetical protein